MVLENVNCTSLENTRKSSKQGKKTDKWGMALKCIILLWN